MKETNEKEKEIMKLNKNTHLALALAALPLVTACDLRDFVPVPGIEVVQPAQDSMVTNPVYFELDAKHWDIEPPTQRRDGAGYFVLVLEGGCVPVGRLVPFEQQYVHLQDGAFTSWIDLSAGVFEVCVQIADGNHRATSLTETVTFEVVD